MKVGFLYGYALGLTTDRLMQLAAGLLGEYLHQRRGLIGLVIPIEGRLHP